MAGKKLTHMSEDEVAAYFEGKSLDEIREAAMELQDEANALQKTRQYVTKAVDRAAAEAKARQMLEGLSDAEREAMQTVFPKGFAVDSTVGTPTAG